MVYVQGLCYRRVVLVEYVAAGVVAISWLGKIREFWTVDEDDGTIRTFSTGATRDTGEDKLEPWGYGSPLVDKVFSEYMLKHQIQSDGQRRESSNWKKGIPVEAFWHSLSRHILDFRLLYEGYPGQARTYDKIETLCAIKFNVDGLIHELMKAELKGMRE